MIHGKNENIRREIASLTKMMTLYTVRRLEKQEIISFEDTV
jgi:D-alanyl-D-alanine carboxypeptidase